MVIAGDLSRHLMDPEPWRISPAVGYSETPASLRREYPNWKDRWMEPNVVNVRGRLMVLSRTRIAGQTTANLCGVCDLTINYILSVCFTLQDNNEKEIVP